MLTKSDKAALRGTLFMHLDGLVTGPTAYELHAKGLTSFLLEKKSVGLHQLPEHFKVNLGYLNVALRVLCSQGWLTQRSQNEDVIFEINDRSSIAFGFFNNYKECVELIRISENYHSRKFEIEPFQYLKKLHAKYLELYEAKKAYNGTTLEIYEQILAHIEGFIIGPSLVHLGMSGMFHKYFMMSRFKPEEFHKDAESFGELLKILSSFGLFNRKNDSFEFTEKGLFYAKRASAYGVTVSYIPTLRKLDELIFGNPTPFQPDLNGNETHVDREMNIWGSGGAHSGYFGVVDEIIKAVFNQPLDSQPKGILDMGCGNGAFLIHLYSVVEQQTLRGKYLEDYPLFLIGADYNQKALEVSKRNLIQADIWAKIIWGDIGRPDLLAEQLETDYNLQLEDLLNVRSFLDHNRIWAPPQSELPSDHLTGTGAYSSKGVWLSNHAVTASLIEHFQKWSPYVKKHGLLLLELHTIPSEVASQHLGKTAATAYDATHGYSDQYIVEPEVWNAALETAGLKPVAEDFRKFPNSELATVTISRWR